MPLFLRILLPIPHFLQQHLWHFGRLFSPALPPVGIMPHSELRYLLLMLFEWLCLPHLVRFLRWKKQSEHFVLPDFSTVQPVWLEYLPFPPHWSLFWLHPPLWKSLPPPFRSSRLPDCTFLRRSWIRLRPVAGFFRCFDVLTPHWLPMPALLLPHFVHLMQLHQYSVSVYPHTR